MDEVLKLSREGAVAVLTMDSPRRRNALSMQMREAFVEALEALEADRDVRAIVVTGAGGVFSSGGDISGMDATDLAGGRERFRTTHRMVRLMVKGSKPIVAAIEGWCAGGALGLALCCDTLVAAQGARFVASFGKVGLIPDFGCLHLLPQRVGMGPARQIMLYGQPFDTAEARRIGLVDEVVPDGTALETALARAADILAVAPLPVALNRQWLARGLDEALDWERDTQAALFLSADHAEGKAAFLEKRPAVYTGR